MDTHTDRQPDAVEQALDRLNAYVAQARDNCGHPTCDDCRTVPCWRLNDDKTAAAARDLYERQREALEAVRNALVPTLGYTRREISIMLGMKERIVEQMDAARTATPAQPERR